MIPVAQPEIEALRLGRLDGAAPDGVVRRIHADSRVARPGDLFVALNTGTRYVGEARARGAVTLVPDDQHAALAALASLVRDRSDARVVAVVGSTGKTSTKDVLGALCASVVPTIVAEASLNNEIGLPLTVCRLEPETEILVTEMGMRGHGQIGELCAIARPGLTLVTHVGPEHLELVGTVEDAARANAEALDALPPGGTAVVPTDAGPLEPFLTRSDIDVRRFDRAAVARDGDEWVFPLDHRSVRLELPFTQRHLAENVLAALVAYDALGLPLERVGEGASRISLSPWRGEVIALPGGGLVVNDAYNANPTSMQAALRDLVDRAGERRTVAILGEMAELGGHAARYHEEIGVLLAALGVDVLVTVGDGVRGYTLPGVGEMHEVAGPEEAVAFVRPGDAVLVKASRAVGLEGVAAELANIAGTWSES